MKKLQFFEVYAVNREKKAGKVFEVIAKSETEAINEFNAEYGPKGWTVDRVY